MEDNRDFVNAASFEEAAIKISSLKVGEFEDVVFGILNDSGLQQTIVLKSLLKKLIDSGFMDTEQVIFVGALIASCIDANVIKEWFSEKNIEFHSDVDNYAFILDGAKKVKTDKLKEE